VPRSALEEMMTMRKIKINLFRSKSSGMEPASPDTALSKTSEASLKSSHFARFLGVLTVLPKSSEYGRFRLSGVRFFSALSYK